MTIVTYMDLSDRAKYIEDNPPQSPAFGQLHPFSDRQSDPARQIYCGRPQSVALVIPVYGNFLDVMIAKISQ